MTDIAAASAAVIIALIERHRAEVAAAQKRIAELEEAVSTTTLALTAANSLLERGGQKAAPSDKMFAQMLIDYNRAAEVGLAALAGGTDETKP